jgi:hypothetical protein
MTKRELINTLESLSIDDDAPVFVWDADRDAYTSDGDSPSECMYDFDVSVLNDYMTEDEKEYHREIIGTEPRPIIVISFDNPDYEDAPEEVSHG